MATATVVDEPAAPTVVAEPTALVDGDASPARRRRRPGHALLITLGAVVALLAVAAGVLGFLTRRADLVGMAREEAVIAARAAAADISSYDYRTLDADFAKALADTTGTFREEYRTTTQTAVKPTAPKTNAVVQGEVISVGVSAADPDQVVVLAFVNTLTHNSLLPSNGRIDQNRLRMTLDKVDGRWLVSKLEVL